MYVLAFILLYIISTIVTSRIYNELIRKISYRVKFSFAKKGYLLNCDPIIDKKKRTYVGLLTLISKLFKYVPFVNILGALILTQGTIKTYESGKILDKDKFYLSEESRNKFIKSNNFLEKSIIIDVATVDMGIMYFASQFKTSVIVNGILSLNGQLCPLAYTLDEIRLMSKYLNTSFTLGKINGVSVALIGARIFRNIKTFDNDVYEIINDFKADASFKVYLIDEESLTDKDIDALILMIRENRYEQRNKKANNDYSLNKEFKLEKRI